MCVGEEAHMRLLGSVMNFFFLPLLHTRLSMFTFAREGKRRLPGVYARGGFSDMRSGMRGRKKIKKKDTQDIMRYI